MMVCSASASVAAGALAEYAPQSHASPAVQRPIDSPVTVTKVRKPTSELRRQPRADTREALAVGPSRLLPHGVLELLEALLSWQSQGASKVIAQEVKTLVPGI